MSQAAARTLLELMVSMPDSWQHFPPYQETKIGPGQALARLSQETRDVLSELKSDDIRNVYLPGCGAIGPDVEPHRGSSMIASCFISRRESHRQSSLAEASRMKLKFDERVLRGRHR